MIRAGSDRTPAGDDHLVVVTVIITVAVAVAVDPIVADPPGDHRDDRLGP
ncbi:hypothetical protein G6012_03560, partial [Dietzia schimae]|nr:hypothetical protein [Dietzia kunjamensis subsp. schimae]